MHRMQGMLVCVYLGVALPGVLRHTQLQLQSINSQMPRMVGVWVVWVDTSLLLCPACSFLQAATASRQ